jgi:hypothetical protein
MARIRTYATAADRQRAYRDRLAGRAAAAYVPAKPRRPASRPARLTTLVDAVRALQMEYEVWLDSLPESLANGGQAENLRETIEQLEAAADTLVEIQPPRRFGRR